VEHVLLVIAGQHGPAASDDELPASQRQWSTIDNVPVDDDPVRLPPGYVISDRLQRRQIAVYVGEDGESHRSCPISQDRENVQAQARFMQLSLQYSVEEVELSARLISENRW
jgi:hypothetical protein